MKVAMTGATGFTGRRVMLELVKRGYDVTALVRPPRERVKNTEPNVRWIVGDMGDPSSLRILLKDARAFVHVASLGFGHADAVVTAVDDCQIPRSVFFSSTSIFTKLPAASKELRQQAEARIRRSPGAWTILRPTMIYGDSGDRNMSRLIAFLSRTPIIPLPGNGRGLIQPVYVEDLAVAAIDALECPKTEYQEYNLPGATASPLRDIVLYLRHLLGRRSLVVPLPTMPVELATRLWSLTGLPPKLKPEQVLRLNEDKSFSYRDAERDWGYKPRSWQEGLVDELECLKRDRFPR